MKCTQIITPMVLCRIQMHFHVMLIQNELLCFHFLVGSRKLENCICRNCVNLPKKSYKRTFLSCSLFVFDIHISCLKLAGCFKCIWIVKDESCCGRQPVKFESETRGSPSPVKFLNTIHANKLAWELSCKGNIVSQALA